MTFHLKLSSLSQEQIDEIKKIVVKPASSLYDPWPIVHQCFIIHKFYNLVSLPLGLWPHYCSSFPNTYQYDIMNKNAHFCKTLLTAETDPSGRRRDQNVVMNQALEQLKTKGSTFLALHTGYGKSACGIYLSIQLGYKTMIVTHFDTIKRQWADEYDYFSNKSVKVQFLNKPQIVLDPDADVYIIGIQKCLSLKADYVKHIGTVIIDEAHVATLTAFTQGMFKFKPRYLIGLSATPDRPDGLHQLFNYSFGDIADFIIRTERKPFTVYKVKTSYQPDIVYKKVNRKITVDWNTVVNSIEENKERWQLIVDIVLCHPERKIIILCNRKVLSKGVYQLLLQHGCDVELFIDTQKEWNKNAKILVTSYKKGGVGLNDPMLDMAIIASDTKDVRQYEGRIRTINNIIYHLVDDYKPFENHFKECHEWYVNKGAHMEQIDHMDVAIKLLIVQKYKNYLLLKYLDLIYDIKNMILNDYIDVLTNQFD